MRLVTQYLRNNAMKAALTFIVGLLSITLIGCAHIPSVDSRLTNADNLADKNGWHREHIKTSYFELVSYYNKNSSSAASLLTIYVEGDGLAWITPHQASMNPTPINPVALKLSINDTNSHVAYLARPCQFTKDKQCNKHYWTNKRFAEEVVSSSSEAISVLKKVFGAKRLRLIGYSGGGAIAALVAARRNDVSSLVTVAGNLDHEAWSAFHKTTPLRGSLNPYDYKYKLNPIKQIHFVGEQDKVIPPFLTQGFADGSPSMQVIVRQKHGHTCCWVKSWAELQRYIRQER